MFSLLHRATSSSSSHRRRPSLDASSPLETSSRDTLASAVSLQPAIDGPPSPEHIRAYTEQMRRGTPFTRQRSYTSSSATPSFRSGSSGAVETSSDRLSLSRRSSQRSNASSMPSKNGERPESMLFGKGIFSRSSKKHRRETGSRSSSSLSNMIGELQAAKEHSGRKLTRRGTYSASTPSLEETIKQNISSPYNFQHLTHTRHEQLPNLARASRTELVSEFTAIRASQAPTRGQLKGIRADDLTFKNFSSEALHTAETDARPRTSPQLVDLDPNDVASNLETLLKLTHPKSAENLRSAPPRPPRSPATVPIPPPRSSSWNSLRQLNTFDPLAPSSFETGTPIRKPKAFHLPTSPQRVITRGDRTEDILERVMGPPRAPDANAWPLSAPFDGVQLADVPEEDETRLPSRRARLSALSSELRHSRSVPLFAPSKPAKDAEMAPLQDQRPKTPLSRVILGDRIPEIVGDIVPEIGLAISPAPPEADLPILSHQISLSHDSWEDDIDYCYEHEAEANCNYDWDRSSMYLDRQGSDSTINPTPKGDTEVSDDTLNSSPDTQPALVEPALGDFPGLSPVSTDTMESPEVVTPGLLRPSHLRSTSRASSFKESQGFNLSPSLLIPNDYAAHMVQDALYDELLMNNQDRHDLHTQPSFDPFPLSPVDRDSSTASYRSSAFSRASGSATTLSKNGSEESILLSRAANVALAHRSVSSTASLPELVHSRSKSNSQELESPLTHDLPAVAPLRRKHSMGMGFGPIEQVETVLSPVAESFKDAPTPPMPNPGPSHGRKVSAPVLSMAPVVPPRTRTRAMSAKSRSNYNIFPQI